MSLLLRFLLPGTKNPVTTEAAAADEEEEEGGARLEGTDICDSGDGE